MMKPTQEQVIAWAREAGMEPTTWQLSFGYETCGTHEELERFAALAYEAGRKDENETHAELVEALRRMKLEKGFVCDCGIEDATWNLIEAIQEKTDGNH